MSVDCLVYRIYRLRRLFAVAALPPLIALSLMEVLGTPVAPVFYLLGVLVPWAHILRYPSVWNETIAVSLTSMLVFCLAAMVPAGASAAAWVGLSLALATLALMAFLVLVPILGVASLAGSARTQTIYAQHWSRLTPEALRRGITNYPGRSDDRVTCGPADADGIFKVTCRHTMASIGPSLEAGDPGFNGGNGDLEDWQLDRPDENGEVPYDVEMYAKVARSDGNVHEVFTIPDGGDGVSVSRHRFSPKDGGTLVEYSELASDLTTGSAIGMWITDYVADYLTDEIDRAEGRAVRALRFSGQHQLVVDIARLFTQATAGPDLTRQ